MGEKMNDRRVITLSVNGEVYEKYRKHCEKEGIILSKQVEKFMAEELKKNKEG